MIHCGKALEEEVKAYGQMTATNIPDKVKKKVASLKSKELKKALDKCRKEMEGMSDLNFGAMVDHEALVKEKDRYTHFSQ